MAVTSMNRSTVLNGRKYQSFLAGNYRESFEFIERQTTVGTSTLSVTFSSIPTNYTNLVIRYYTQSQNEISTQEALVLQFNNDTANNYTRIHFLQGNGTTPAAGYSGAAGAIWGGRSACQPSQYPNTYGVGEIYLFNYRDVSKKKMVMSYSGMENNVGIDTIISTGSWNITNAINSITIKNDSGLAFSASCFFGLYGVK